MDFDLEYDYAEALKRQGHKQSDVDALRKVVEQYPMVPKSITNKKVSLFLKFKQNVVFMNKTLSASFVLGFVRRC